MAGLRPNRRNIGGYLVLLLGAIERADATWSLTANIRRNWPDVWSIIDDWGWLALMALGFVWVYLATRAPAIPSGTAQQPTGEAKSENDQVRPPREPSATRGELAAKARDQNPPRFVRVVSYGIDLDHLITDFRLGFHIHLLNSLDGPISFKGGPIGHVIYEQTKTELPMARLNPPKHDGVIRPNETGTIEIAQDLPPDVGGRIKADYHASRRSSFKLKGLTIQFHYEGKAYSVEGIGGLAFQEGLQILPIQYVTASG